MKYEVDSSQYSEFPTGISSDPDLRSSLISIAVDPNTGFIYVSGPFSGYLPYQNNSNRVEVNNAMYFNGTNWVGMGLGLDFISTSIVIDQSGNNVYFSSSFSFSTNTNTSFFAVWNTKSQEWSFPFEGSSYSYSLMPFESDSILMGGGFKVPNSECVSSFGIFYPSGNAPPNPPNPTSSNWVGLGGTDGETHVVALGRIESNEIFVGGNFINANGQTMNNIAKFDGQKWIPLKGGVSVDGDSWSASVNALQVVGSDLYVGGFFTKVDGFQISSNYFAKYDGENWIDLGIPQLNYSSKFEGLETISFIPSKQLLLIGGTFNVSTFSDNNQQFAWNIAFFNVSNQTFSSVGGSVNGHVFAIAIDPENDLIYVGGVFNKSGDLDCSGIAKWNGSHWSNLDGGVQSDDNFFMVKSITFWSGKLFVGGEKKTKI